MFRSTTNTFEEPIASATSENLTSENWQLILEVCDKVHNANDARDCIAVVQKRLQMANANVQLYTLTLTEALVKNCGVELHREVASRAFTSLLVKLAKDKANHERVRTRILELVQQWSHEFRSDPSLGIMEETYQSLRQQGFVFPSPQKPKKEYTQTELDRQKEEEELQLALALSLSESEKHSSRHGYQPQQHKMPDKPKEPEQPQKVSRVRALYDFVPTEQGELGFQKGDVIRVLESHYRDWWKGQLQGRIGIFPVNYVEFLQDPTPEDLVREAEMESQVLSESKNIEDLVEMLSSVDPQKDNFSENERLQTLYNRVLTIRPKLVKLIEKYSQRKDELISLNDKFLKARGTYDQLMEASISRYSGQPPAHHAHHAQNYGSYPPQGYSSAPASTAPYSPSVPFAPLAPESQYPPPYPPQQPHGYGEGYPPGPVGGYPPQHSAPRQDPSAGYAPPYSHLSSPPAQQQQSYRPEQGYEPPQPQQQGTYYAPPAPAPPQNQPGPEHHPQPPVAGDYPASPYVGHPQAGGPTYPSGYAQGY
ncbi:uncharacterized protein VTP21DRAFT_4860 [Calcarisporiella thermophila]|uniref:uncharacterized protein n=1 Tax=Calcarisporiella thermophila TaxID=911321 RepID=UPI0037443756